MSQHFDAVVIGGRLSATIAAALFVKRGARTLLIDQGELNTVDRHLLDDLVWVDADSAIMRRVHEELGIEQDVSRKPAPIRPWVQAIFPDHRLEIAPDRERLSHEVRRELHHAADALPDVLTRLTQGEAEVGAYLLEAGELPPRTGLFSGRTAAGAARRHGLAAQPLSEAEILAGAPDDLILLLLGALPFVTHLDARTPEDLTVARFARPVGRFLRGAGRLEDPGGLRALYLDVAQRRAFEVKRGAVERLEPTGRRAELRLAGERDDITCDVLVDATADLSGLDAVPSKRQRKEFALMLQSARPRGFLHVLGIEVDAHVLPPGMAAHCLLLNGRRDPARLDERDPAGEDRPIWLSQRPGAQDGRVQLVAAHPVSSVRAHAQGLDALEEVMRARIERLLPFLEDGRPHFQALAGRGDRPVLPHPLYDPELDPATGLCGVSMRTTFKNVFVAGPAVLPGLGVEGEYLSALQAVEAAEAQRTGTKPKKLFATA